MNEESLGVNGQPYRIVYQCKRDKGKHYCQRKQHQADIPYIVIHRVNQLLPIEHILYVGIPLDLLLYLRDTVGIRILGMELDFDRSGERIITQKLFVVAQRIATVLNADKILVLEDGELVGSGTHKELLSTCPTYREIAQSQLSEEELKGDVA